MPEPTSRFTAFITELRRRRVFRVAAFYGGIAFVIIQIIDGAFDYLHIPEWFGTAIIVLLILGFPIAIGLTWIFDITEKGIVRTEGPQRHKPKDSRHPIIGNYILAIIAVAAVAVAVWSWRGRASLPAPIRSIAVLPLANLSGDPEQDYFVNGMHEALISELSKIGAVTVISRQSTLQYKDSEKTMPVIAAELGVDALVEGSALLLGERVRITTQLIDSQDRHLWSNTYERNLEDVFALYNEVTLAIAREIQAKLTPEEEIRLASAPQVNPEAYTLYLKGWHFRNLGNFSKAVEYLEQAVALDSTLAQAWAVLAYVYLYDWITWNPLVVADPGLILMKQTLDKALDLDPALPEAHTHLGYYLARKWDFVAADASLRRALELDPDNTWGRTQYGWFLQRHGQPDEALAEFRRAQELDPLSHLPPWGIAGVYRNTREYDKALEYLQATSELQPGKGDWFVIRLKRLILMQQGRYAEAAAEAGKAYAEATDGTPGKGFYFWLWLRAEWARGNKEKVYAVRDSLRSTGELQQRGQENPHWSARLYAIMGERDKALSLLEKAYEDTTKEFYYFRDLVYAPEFDFLRAEPRFKALFQKLGLPEVLDQSGQRIR